MPLAAGQWKKASAIEYKAREKNPAGVKRYRSPLSHLSKSEKRTTTANAGLSPMSPTSLGSKQLHDYTFDAEYLARLRARDPGTLAHFYDFFKLPVRNKIRHRCRWEDADDLVQDVFVAALKRIDAGEPEDPAKLPVYILGIC